MLRSCAMFFGCISVLAQAADTVPITVRLGTGSQIVDNGATYSMPISALASDASGNPVKVKLLTKATSTQYQKGQYEFSSPYGESPYWHPVYTIARRYPRFGCQSEDANRNGILDDGEDRNSNGLLDPGTVVSSPSSLVVDGSGTFAVTWPKAFSSWVMVVVVARATRPYSGSYRFSFVLPGAYDPNDPTVAPSWSLSPFGVSSSCRDAQ